MNQQGFIVEIVDDKTAKMRMQRHSACASCGKCAKLTSESQDLIVEVDNQIGAKVGDHVKVMKATMLAYILPLIFLVAGTAISFGVLNAISFKGPLEVISGLCGLLCTFLSYLYLRKNDKKYRDSRDYIPVVVRIV